MKKILIGWIADGKAGGVDKYILDFYQDIRPYAQVDFMSNVGAGELAEQMKNNGSKWFTVANLMHPVKQYRALKQIVQENGYDAVYFNYSTAIGWTAVKGARDGGASHVIVHAHNSGFYDNNPLKQYLFRAAHYLFRPLMTRYVTDFLSCSDKAADWVFGKKTVKSGRIRYISNKIDLQVFHPSKEKRQRYRQCFGVEENFVIGNVGNLQKVKNQAFLIRLLPELKKAIPNVKLLLIGQGKEYHALQELTGHLGLSGDVIFAGYLDTSDGVMNAFDIFCLPSLIEGYPYVVVEAQSLNIPCVLSDRITRQVLQTGKGCFLSLKRPDQWATVISQYRQGKFLPNEQAMHFEKNEFMTRIDFMEDICKNKEKDL